MPGAVCQSTAVTAAPPARYIMSRSRCVCARSPADGVAPSLRPTANRRGRGCTGASRPMQPDPPEADHVAATASPLPGRLCDNPLRDDGRHEAALALRAELIASIRRRGVPQCLLELFVERLLQIPDFCDSAHLEHMIEAWREDRRCLRELLQLVLRELGDARHRGQIHHS